MGPRENQGTPGRERGADATTWWGWFAGPASSNPPSPRYPVRIRTCAPSALGIRSSFGPVEDRFVNRCRIGLLCVAAVRGR